MKDEHQNIVDRLTGLLNDDNIQVAIQEQGCVLTYGPVSGLVKPDNPSRCLVIFQSPDSDWIYKTGLPVSWKPDRLPLMEPFITEWTGYPVIDGNKAIRILMLTVNRHWTDLVAILETATRPV